MPTQIRDVAALHGACAALGLVVILAASCTTPTSKIRLPACVDQITVAGQHARGSQTTLLLDHTYDLPFTQTAITLEERDGSVRELVVTNSVPDLWRLVGGGLVGVLGAALLARYAVALQDGDDVLRTGWFWALPAGLFGGGVGGLMLITGWHPPGDTLVDYKCPMAPSGDAPPAVPAR